MTSSYAQSIARIREVHRWITSAVALVTRPDRENALLERYERLEARRTTLGDAHASFEVHVEEDTDGDLPEEAVARVRADVDQAQEMMDELTEAARKVLALRTQRREGGSGGMELIATPPGLLSRLPTLTLPRFDGRPEQWVAFHNLFDSLVHARTDVSPAMKLAHLVAALDGEAKGVVQHLALTDDNYSVARGLLIARYQNVRELVDTHLGQIMGLPIVTTPTQLRSELLNPLSVAVNALRMLGLPVDQWSAILVYIVLGRLPTELRARFEQTYGGSSAQELPEFRDLLTFLGDECRRTENVARVGPAGPSPRPRQESTRRDTRVPETRRPRGRYAPVQQGDQCLYCREAGHNTSSCDRFLAQRTQGRRAIVAQRRWCYFCLEAHFQRDCPRPRPCGQCGGGHHAVLCMNANGASRGSNIGEDRQDGGPMQERSQDGSPRGHRRSPRPEGRELEPPQGSGPFTGGCRRESHPPAYDRSDREQVRPEAHREYSPPLAEYPRLERRPPPARRTRGYRPPAAARLPQHPAYTEWETYPRLDRPRRWEGERAPSPIDEL